MLWVYDHYKYFTLSVPGLNTAVSVRITCVAVNGIALRRLLHNHGNIATEGNPKSGLCPTLIE